MSDPFPAPHSVFDFLLAPAHPIAQPFATQATLKQKAERRKVKGKGARVRVVASTSCNTANPDLHVCDAAAGAVGSGAGSGANVPHKETAVSDRRRRWYWELKLIQKWL